MFTNHIVFKSGTYTWCMQTEQFQMFDKCYNCQCCTLGILFLQCSVALITQWHKIHRLSIYCTTLVCDVADDSCRIFNELKTPRKLGKFWKPCITRVILASANYSVHHYIIRWLLFSAGAPNTHRGTRNTPYYTAPQAHGVHCAYDIHRISHDTEAHGLHRFTSFSVVLPWLLTYYSRARYTKSVCTQWRTAGIK